METKFRKHMRRLWRLAGEIGTIGEDDGRYAAVYKKLSDALDKAEENDLITNMYDGFIVEKVKKKGNKRDNP